MIVFDLVGDNEDHPVYQSLTIQNGARQYDFLRSVVETALVLDRPFLSTQVIKALNYHAIACLHAYAGEFRPCQVYVGTHTPPAEYRVQALMDDFVNWMNLNLKSVDPVVLAAYALWRFNYIHPFINGNGRTARAVCYFVLCITAGGWLPGAVILPELIKRERDRYVLGLRFADATNGNIILLHGLLADLLFEQIHGAPPDDGGQWAAAMAAVAPSNDPVATADNATANGNGANALFRLPPPPDNTVDVAGG
ncbi:Fic family protein [Burkholderia cenocepacia]|uniref:Fic family protein n=1 Tax=Burkholderia cenocepacia TaxID=95486 RepID=UPI002B251C33|nr:Fic family protein [Burkholderia cenocepacia]MEB2605985.1 Fic family protein [Burkholderia cenocepacia]